MKTGQDDALGRATSLRTPLPVGLAPLHRHMNVYRRSWTGCRLRCYACTDKREEFASRVATADSAHSC